MPWLSLFTSKTVVAGLVCGAAFVGLQVLASAWLESFAYLRSALEDGQLWRLITGHYVHFTVYHAVMNAAGLILVCLILLNRQSLLFFCGINIALPAMISIGLWFFYDNIEHYRGYSAVIYGLVAAGLILEWRNHKGMYSLALLLLGAKIMYEQLPSYDVNYLVAEIGVPVAIEAHLLGFCGGMLCAAVVLAFRYCGRRAPTIEGA